jgi:predicted metal-dependent hydrolase
LRGIDEEANGESLAIGGLSFEVRRSDRRRTRELTVDRNGELVVHAPRSAPTDELRAWIESKLLWVNRKLLAKEARLKDPTSLDVVSGETITYLGRSYRLKIVKEREVPLRLWGEWFCLRDSARTEAPALFQQWYRVRGTQWLKKRISVWTSRVGVTLPESK